MGPFRQGKPVVLPTPELDEYEKELRARSHRKVMYAGIACIALCMPLMVLLAMAIVPELVYHVKHPLHGVSPATKEKGRAAAAEARAVAAAEESRMSQGIATAIREGVTSHPELGRCPYTHSAAARHDDFFFTASFARADEARICRSCRRLDAAAEEIERFVDVRAREDDLDTQMERRIASAKLERYAVVLHVDKEVAPHGTPHVDFTPGLVLGRAFVWDTKAHQVICAGRVRAENAEVVDYTYTTQNGIETRSFAELDAALKKDLAKQTEVAVASALHYVAGPRIDDE